MRTAGRFQAIKLDPKHESYDLAFKTITDWKKAKYSSEERNTTISKTGDPAEVTERNTHGNAARYYDVRTSELSTSNSIDMLTRLLHVDQTTYFDVEIRVGGLEDVVSDTSFIVKSPAFFKKIVGEINGWHYRLDGDRIVPKVFQVSSSNVSEFLTLLDSPKRRLPIVAVSVEDGNEVVAGVSERLRYSLLGISHICTVDETAAWEITNSFGLEWSVYRKAIRVYWPRTVFRSSPFKHRLWLPRTFEELDLDSRDSDWRVANRIGETIVAASAFSPRISEIADWERKSDQSVFEAALKSIRDKSDYEALEQVYAAENDRLRLENTRLAAEVELLQIRVGQTGNAQHSADSSEIDSDEGNLYTVLANWQTAPDSGLIFSDDVETHFASINAAACPPEKLDRHLRALSELSAELRLKNGSIGDTIVKWLKARNIEASNESDTKKGSGLFQFPVLGKNQTFELHMKVTNATAPDRCIRIYFKPEDDYSCVVVGFVGSKKFLD